MLLDQLPHTFDHYAASYATKSGGKPTLTLTTEAVKCWLQPGTSTNWQEQKQDNERSEDKVYLTSASAYAAVKVADRLVIDEVNYYVKGKKDMSGLGEVFYFTVITDVRT